MFAGEAFLDVGLDMDAIDALDAPFLLDDDFSENLQFSENPPLRATLSDLIEAPAEHPPLRTTLSDLIATPVMLNLSQPQQQFNYIPHTHQPHQFNVTEQSYSEGNCHALFQTADDYSSDSSGRSPYSTSSQSPPSLKLEPPMTAIPPIMDTSRRKRKTAKEIAAMSAEERQQDKQIRNKVSANKYRKKRKLLVDKLEDQLTDLSSTVDTQKAQITSLESENKVLREQLGFIKSLLWSQKTGTLPTSQVQVNMTNSFPPIPQATGVFFCLFACVMVVVPSWSHEPHHPKTFARAGRVLLNVDHHEPSMFSLSFVTMSTCVAFVVLLLTLAKAFPKPLFSQRIESLTNQVDRFVRGLVFH